MQNYWQHCAAKLAFCTLPARWPACLQSQTPARGCRQHLGGSSSSSNNNKRVGYVGLHVCNLRLQHATATNAWAAAEAADAAAAAEVSGSIVDTGQCILDGPSVPSHTPERGCHQCLSSSSSTQQQQKGGVGWLACLHCSLQLKVSTSSRWLLPNAGQQQRRQQQQQCQAGGLTLGSATLRAQEACLRLQQVASTHA
jgi:hypothetical protein